MSLFPAAWIGALCAGAFFTLFTPRDALACGGTGLSACAPGDRVGPCQGAEPGAACTVTAVGEGTCEPEELGDGLECTPPPTDAACEDHVEGDACTTALAGPGKCLPHNEQLRCFDNSEGCLDLEEGSTCRMDDGSDGWCRVDLANVYPTCIDYCTEESQTCRTPEGEEGSCEVGDSGGVSCEVEAEEADDRGQMSCGNDVCSLALPRSGTGGAAPLVVIALGLLVRRARRPGSRVA